MLRSFFPWVVGVKKVRVMRGGRSGVTGFVLQWWVEGWLLLGSLDSSLHSHVKSKAVGKLHAQTVNDQSREVCTYIPILNHPVTLYGICKCVVRIMYHGM